MNWKIALALSVPVAASWALTGGCTGDECTRADDHIAECALPIQSGASSGGMAMPLDCTPGSARVCQAKCINAATCPQINESQCVNQLSCAQIQGKACQADADCPSDQACDPGSMRCVSVFAKCILDCRAH